MFRLFKIFKFIIFFIILGVIAFVAIHFLKPFDYKYNFEQNIQVVAFYDKDNKIEDIIKDSKNEKAIRKLTKKNKEDNLEVFKDNLKSIKAKKPFLFLHNNNKDIVGYIKIIFNDAQFHILTSNEVIKVNIIENVPETNKEKAIFDLERFKFLYNFNNKKNN